MSAERKAIYVDDLWTALKKVGTDVREDVVDYECEYGYSQFRLESVINELPAAHLEPVRSKPTKFYNDPWTGRMFTTCLRCMNKVGPHDNYCKSCGAKFMEDEPNE